MRSMISKKALVVVRQLPCCSRSDSRPAAATTQQQLQHDRGDVRRDDDSTASGSNTSAGVVVTIKNFTFSTKPVKAGESFQVENKDDTEHTFTSDDGKFDVKVPAGKTVTVDALTAGTYKFHCSIHSSMHGTLEVS